MATEGAPAVDTPGSIPEHSVYAEDLTVGELVQLGRYPVSRAEILEFAGHWDDQWFHTDEAAAANGHFGDVIASGIHTMAIMQRLTVQEIYGRWAVVAGRGLDRVRFVEAVRPGDTITGTIEVTGVQLDRARGRVTMHNELVNQHGRTVLVADLTIMMFRRTPEAG